MKAMKKFYLCKLYLIIFGALLSPKFIHASQCTGELEVYKEQISYFQKKPNHVICREVQAYQNYKPQILPESDDCLYFAAAFEMAKRRQAKCAVQPTTVQQSSSSRNKSQAVLEKQVQKNNVIDSETARTAIKIIGYGIANSLGSHSGSSDDFEQKQRNLRKEERNLERKEREMKREERKLERLCEKLGGRYSSIRGKCR